MKQSPFPGVAVMEALPRERLLVLAGCDDARLSDLERLGIIGHEHAGYAASDVSRLRLILALQDAGISLDVLAEGLKQQIFSLEFANQLMFEPVTMTEALVVFRMRPQQYKHHCRWWNRAVWMSCRPCESALLRDRWCRVTAIFSEGWSTSRRASSPSPSPRKLSFASIRVPPLQRQHAALPSRVWDLCP